MKNPDEWVLAGGTDDQSHNIRCTTKTKLTALSSSSDPASPQPDHRVRRGDHPVEFRPTKGEARIVAGDREAYNNLIAARKIRARTRAKISAEHAAHLNRRRRQLI